MISPLSFRSSRWVILRATDSSVGLVLRGSARCRSAPARPAVGVHVLSYSQTVKLVPGAVKRWFIRVVRATIRHPVAHLVHPLHVEIAELKGQIAAVQEQVAKVGPEWDPILAELDQRQQTMHAILATFDLTAQDLLERIEGNEGHLRRLADEISQLQGDSAGARSELRLQRSRLELVLREARRALPEQLERDQLATLTGELDRLLGEHYGEFETAFRGSRDTVRERQKTYLEDVLPLRSLSAPVVDLGSGRGEWLELLRDHDVSAYGVDTNELFREQNRERGLDVKHEDALAHLRGLPESTLAVLTAFHLIEHLAPEDLIELVDAALRVLRPGGLLILETPNPMNLEVGASTFHIDPTHRKPVHPMWLEFLLTTRGFVDVELRYLNPAPEVQLKVPSADGGGDPERLRTFVQQANDVLFGPRDYAAIARKPAPQAD
jgi:SAM-dependent methyltransferase